MIQIYLLTLLYMIFGEALLFTCKYGNNFLFLITIKTSFLRNKKARVWAIIIGFALALGNIIFPVEPGPIVIGDFFPAISCLGIAIYYMALNINPEDEDYNLVKDKTYIWGWVITAVFILHFLFPSLVLF